MWPSLGVPPGSFPGPAVFACNTGQAAAANSEMFSGVGFNATRFVGSSFGYN